MRLIYNGIDLFALETHEFNAEPVYDDTLTDYLYTKYTIVVTAMVNGQARVTDTNLGMSYQFDGGVVGGTPTIVRPPSPIVGAILPGAADGIDIGDTAGGVSPRSVVITPVPTPTTHQTVRHRLTTPRSPLYVFAGGGMETGVPPAGGFGPPGAAAQLFLTSPVAPYSVDAKNGPTPKLLGITAAMGDAETLIVDFAIETYINEATENNARPNSALLSNRWKQRHSVGRDGYTTVTTEGIAIFRTDLVYFTDTSPDVSRTLIFMPVPKGFVREVDYVDTREDVTGIIYGYHDTQQSVNFVAGPYVGAAEITAVHRQSVTSNVDFLATAVQIAERGLGMLLNAKWLKGERAAAGAARPPKPPGPDFGLLSTTGRK